MENVERLGKTQRGNITTEFDLETGEIKRQYAVVEIKRKQIPGGFFMAMQEGFTYIAKLDLTGEQLKVLMYIMGKLDFENYILLQQKEVAEDLNMRQPHVSRAFSRLVELGVIHEGPKIGKVKTYRLDPSFGWKGKGKNYVKEVNRLRLVRGGKRTPEKED